MQARNQAGKQCCLESNHMWYAANVTPPDRFNGTSMTCWQLHAHTAEVASLVLV